MKSFQCILPLEHRKWGGNQSRNVKL